MPQMKKPNSTIGGYNRDRIQTAIDKSRYPAQDEQPEDDEHGLDIGSLCSSSCSYSSSSWMEILVRIDRQADQCAIIRHLQMAIIDCSGVSQERPFQEIWAPGAARA